MDKTLNSTTRTARARHQCIWCYEAIVVGEKYLDQRVILDGGVDTQRWHPECAADCTVTTAQNGGWLDFSPGEFERPAKEDEIVSRELLIQLHAIEHDKDALLEVCRFWLAEFGELDMMLKGTQGEGAAVLLEKTRLVVARAEEREP